MLQKLARSLFRFPQTARQHKMCAQTNKHRRAPRRPKRRLGDFFFIRIDFIYISLAYRVYKR